MSFCIALGLALQPLASLCISLSDCFCEFPDVGVSISLSGFLSLDLEGREDRG